MFSILKRLIERHYYTSREEAIEKVDVFFAVGRITDEQYAELCVLIDEHYPTETAETVEIPSE